MYKGTIKSLGNFALGVFGVTGICLAAIAFALLILWVGTWVVEFLPWPPTA